MKTMKHVMPVRWVVKTVLMPKNAYNAINRIILKRFKDKINVNANQLIS